MKVLIIGGGGREHAIAEAFAQTCWPLDVFVAPGNAGIALRFPCLPKIRSNSEILAWCEGNHPDLVFIGPEQPLAEGLSDILNGSGISCIGPSQAAARIETSKIFAKELMARNSIPTAACATFKDSNLALRHIRGINHYPVVIKADGLAAGKGVIIAHSQEEAIQAVKTLDSGLGCHSGIVVEEYLTGWEVSVFAISDGVNHKCTLFAQDHKQLGDGDNGPNTGGMGAFCPVPEAEPYRQLVEDRIISPVLQAMRSEGCPYRGFLYAGLMITKSGPQVLEFNCRLGDPETQALLPLLETPLSDICQAIVSGTVDRLNLTWKDRHSVCVVLAAKGYPGAYEKGLPIHIEPSISSNIYYSGVEKSDDGLATGGGRVMSLVAVAGSLEQARAQVYEDIGKVGFTGMYCRKDISRRNNKL